MADDSLRITERLAEYLHIFDGDGIGRLGQSETYYLTHLRTLNQLIVKYSERDLADGGYPELPAGDLDKIQHLYISLMMLSEKILANRNPSRIEKKFMYITKQVRDIMLEDGSVILSLKPEPGIVLPAMIAKARAREVSVNNPDLSTAGASSSVRIPLEYTDENGILHQGFFTEGHTLKNREMEEATYQLLLKEKIEKGTNYRRVYQKMREHSKDDFFFTVFQADLHTEHEIQRYVGFLTDRLDFDEDEARELAEDENFRKELQSFQKSFGEIQNLDVKYSGLDASEESGVETRNNAMYNVASMLGVGHLIARSENLIVNLNGRKISGSFMDTVYGSDFDHIKENDPIAKWSRDADADTSKLKMSPNAFKQMAQISVLDFLCANVDRHQGNFIYHFDQSDPDHPVLSGVTGIDNDLSMGTTILPGGNSTQLKDLRYIDEALAKQICSMTKEAFTYHLLGQQLSKAEIDVAWDRCVQLQDSIKKGKETYKEGDNLYAYQPDTIRILKDEEFEQLNIGEIFDANAGSFTIYQRVGYMGIGAVDRYERQKQQGFQNHRIVYNRGTLTRSRAADPIVTVRTKLQGLASVLSRNDPMLHKNSGVYKTFRNKLNDLLQKMNNITEEEELLEDYMELRLACKAYIEAKDGLPSSDFGKRRLEVARELNAYMKERRAELRDPAKTMQRRIDRQMNRVRASRQDCQSMLILGERASRNNLENDVARVLALHRLMQQYKMQWNGRIFNKSDQEIEDEIADVKRQPHFGELVDGIIANKTPMQKFTYQSFAAISDEIDSRHEKEAEQERMQRQPQYFSPLQKLNRQFEPVLQEDSMREKQLLRPEANEI